MVYIEPAGNNQTCLKSMSRPRADGTTIMESSERHSEIKKARQKLTFLSVWLIVSFAACATVNVHIPPLFASAVSQDARSGIQRPSHEDTNSLLEAVERDIAGNKFGETESGLSAYLKDHPDSWRAHYDLGYVQFRTHKIGSSIRELSRSLELNPQNAEAHKILGLGFSIIGRYDLAEVELLQAVRLKPSSAEMHYSLARTYYTRGVYPLAKSEFETTIRLDSSYVKAYSNLGITMEALGDNDAALKNYMMAIQLQERQEQRSEWPYIYLSAFYNHQKNAAGALDYARKALEVNPSSDAVYFEMAKAYRTQVEWQKAADALRSAIAINSQVPDYYYVLGLMLRKLGNQRESEEALAKYAHLQKASVDVGHELPERDPLEPLNAPEPR
jgi:tetratricopeptide (TPR) repeat protein